MTLAATEVDSLPSPLRISDVPAHLTIGKGAPITYSPTRVYSRVAPTLTHIPLETTVRGEELVRVVRSTFRANARPSGENSGAAGSSAGAKVRKLRCSAFQASSPECGSSAPGYCHHRPPPTQSRRHSSELAALRPVGVPSLLTRGVCAVQRAAGAQDPSCPLPRHPRCGTRPAAAWRTASLVRPAPNPASDHDLRHRGRGRHLPPPRRCPGHGPLRVPVPHPHGEQGSAPTRHARKGRGAPLTPVTRTHVQAVVHCVWRGASGTSRPRTRRTLLCRGTRRGWSASIRC